MEDHEFRGMLRDILADARKQNLNEAEKALGLTEAGDEFGDVDLGNWRDIQGIATGPVGDVLKTGWGNLLKIGSKARKLVDTTITGLKTLASVFVAGKFDEISRRDDARQRAIESKYGNIIGRARQLFKGDVLLGAFMLNPAMMLASAASVAAPEKVLELTKALVGPESKSNDSIDKLMGSMLRGEGKYSLRRVLIEVSVEDKRRVQTLVSDLADEIRDSNITKDMQRASQNRYNTMLHDLIDVADDASKIATVEGFESFFGKEFPGKKEVEAIEDEAARREYVSTTIEKAKAAVMQSIVSSLQSKISYLKQFNVPEGAGIVTAHENAINKIQAQMPRVGP